METQNSFCYVLFLELLAFLGKGSSNSSFCTIAEKNPTYVDSRTWAENTYTNFSYQLTTLLMGKNSEDPDFRIEIKLCEAGERNTLCICRRIFEHDPTCKTYTNNTVCDADISEMRLSVLVKRTYSDIAWVYFKQNSTPVVLIHTKLQVTHPPEITGLLVNGQEVNDTHLVHENQEVNVSCSFTNGNPPVSVRIINPTGHTLSSVDDGKEPLVLNLGVLHCHAVWPTVRCEAQGSELSRSVSILVRCPPQAELPGFSSSRFETNFYEGLTVGMKSYTSDIRKCLMTQPEPKPSAWEVKCEVSGRAPKFILTVRLDTETWIEEGIWTLQVTSELQTSNITLHLNNKAGCKILP